MKKWMYAVLLLCICTGVLAGCGSVSMDDDSSTVYVDKKGRITSVDVEDLGESIYDAQELESFVNDAVAEYTEEHGKNSVTVNGLTVEDGLAKLSLAYQSAQDYTNFHNTNYLGVELFSGELMAALEAGYVFDGDFARVEKGQVVGIATKQEIYAEEGLKVVVIRANTDVQVEGDICYVSCENVRLDGTNRVSIREGYRLDNGAPANEEIPGVEDPDGTEEADTDKTEVIGPEPESVIGSEVYTFIVYR